MNIYELFRDASRRDPDRVALAAGVGSKRQSMTYAELDRRVDGVTAILADQGLEPGDRVLLAVPVSIDTYVVMLALLKGGLVVMYIDPGHGAAKASRILNRWPPAAVVTSKPLLLLGQLFPEFGRIPQRFVVGGRWPGATSLCATDAAPVPARTRSSGDAAILSFTSGTTGEPKALIRTHGFLRKQLCALCNVAELKRGDVDFVAMPMLVLFNLAHSITSVLPACNMKHPGKADPRLVLNQLRAEKATRMVASPALLERLACYCLVRKQTIPELRCVSTGGGPVSPSLPQRLRRVAPNAIVRTVYGSTEAEPIASIDAHEVSLADRGRTREGGGLLAGKPVRGCAVRIISSRPGQAIGTLTEKGFSRLCVRNGSTGEIVVSGKHVVSGYADPAQEADTKIRVADTVWHRTGDAGYFDSRGRLWLVGRCSAMLRDYRGTAYPFQVEHAVGAVRGVRRAALTAIGGDRVLVLETVGREFNESCAEAASCVARFEIDRIVTVNRIPVDKRHDAKVDYPALNRLLDGRCRRYRDRIAEIISMIFTTCRDAVTTLKSRARVRPHQER